MVADYYAMLGVDPRSDRAAIEMALSKAQPVWSAGTRNPKNKHTFQSYLDQIPAIRQALLGDPSSRLAYDAELAAARRAERDKTLDAFHKRVRLRAAKGGLTVLDRKLLRTESIRLGVTPDEFDRLLQPYPPMPETPVEIDVPEPPADVIDPATRRQIRIALEHLRRRDLYDVLGLARDAPMAEIVARSDAERQRWMHKAQVTAEKTAWLEAISYAQSHLTHPDYRARYDRTLQAETEDALIESISFAIQGTATLSGSTRQFIRDEAAATGITPDRADRLIDRVCRTMGVARDGASPSFRVNGLVRYLRCRSCSGLTEYALASRSSDSAVCQHCRATLRWSCPVCQRSRWVDESRCACGFPLEYVEPLVRYFEAAQHAHRARDFAAALANLRRVQEYAPRHIGARKGIEKIKERLAQIDHTRTIYEAERSRRHLIAARGALAAWSRLVDPSTPELRQASSEVAETIRQAMALVAKADTIETTDPQGARTLYKQALSIAADLPEAREGLRLCPPEPPADLLATIVSDRVRLRWTAPPLDGLAPFTYRIQRKRGGIPLHADDGVEIGEVDRTEFEDTTVTPGDTVGYAVFSLRAGVASLTGTTAGPVPILADVTDLRVEPRSREVLLSWSPPPNCVEVRVVRKLLSAPIGPNDGTLVASLRDQAHDRGLTDDKVYHYGVFTLYRTADGRLISSRGAYSSAMPSAPVATVIEPSLSRHGDGSIRISWAPPARGEVHVLRSLQPLPFAAAQRVERGTVDETGGHWLLRAADHQAVDRDPPDVDVLFYTPMIAWGGSLTVGKSVIVTNIAEPRDLRAVRINKAGKVLLRWRWPSSSSRVHVLSKPGGFPTGPDDPSATAVTVDAADYRRAGSQSLNLPPTEAGPWHVAVFAAEKRGGREISSTGLEPTSRTIVPGPNSEVSVSYDVRPHGFFGRTWSVAFHTDPPGSAIPPTALVGHPRTVPLSVDDGEIIAQFPAAQDGETFPIRTKLNLRTHGLRIFADPQADPDGLPPIRIHHPEAEGTRV
ncbi:MAG: hypothetical protein JWN86_2437 [Planctomycetota bacterium]|nr:hypothetical protein [Planctomycetota bacterium]